MNPSLIEIDSETSRIRAALVNSGRHTFSEAEDKLAGSRLTLFLGKDAACTPAGQAAFLTAAATGARCFGEVTVDGCLNPSLLFPLPIAHGSLLEAALHLGAKRGISQPNSRTIFLGGAQNARMGWSVQAFWNGWTAGVTPRIEAARTGRSDCALAGIAAGAIAVGQAFLAEQGDPRAGKLCQNLSLWDPPASECGGTEPGPHARDVYMPTALWLVGLGNLGQAYLWSLSLLPYPRTEDVLIFLQDDQQVGKENWGTSVLVQRGNYGALKTRVTEDWLLRLGFQVRRIDRRLDHHLVRQPAEPAIALAGLDNMSARRLLGYPGFEYVIDSGLGATVREYRKFRLNVFDAAHPPINHFQGVEEQTAEVVQELLKLPSYQELTRTRNDGGCGAAMLAESSVAVPFVSAIVAALAITQAIRIASGQPPHFCLTGDLGDLTTIRGALGRSPERTNLPSVLGRLPS
jgi:hypothetical protein